MSSIEDKLMTLEVINAYLEKFEKDLMDGLNNIQSQLNDLKSSGQWDDVHFSNFKEKYFRLYSASTLFAKNDTKSAREFLENKHQTLTTHKN